MKKLIPVLLIFGIILVSGCAQEPVVGGDVDEHGCKPSAGYTWCEEKQKCLRTWEEHCEVEPPPDLPRLASLSEKDLDDLENIIQDMEFEDLGGLSND